MSELSFTVSDKGTIGLDPLEAPTQRPALPRPLRSSRGEAYDAKRRPQAAVLYRKLRERIDGMSWKECWALGEGNADWDVGPIVVWLRAHGVTVVAEYDVVEGETRFFLGPM